jgi:hypothetical protein
MASCAWLLERVVLISRCELDVPHRGERGMSPLTQERVGFAVRLDAPAVEVGGTARGELVLEPDARLGEVKSFTLSCIRVLEGESGPRQRRFGKPIVHRGRIIPPAKIPFAFTLPEEGPITWSGQQVKTRWQLHLKLETTLQQVEWAEPLQVVPRRLSQLAPSRPVPSTRKRGASGALLGALSILMCWAPCFGAPFYFLSMALSDESSPGERTAGWILGLLSVVAAIAATNFGVARWRSGRGDVSAELLPQRESFALGSTATVRLALHLKKQLRVEGATARLWTRERAEEEQKLHEWTTPVSLPPMLEGDYSLELEFPIPEHIPPTLHSFDLRIESFCEVVLRLRDVEELKLQRELLITPERLVPAGEATETAPPR